jgi:hypothetical protein
MSLYNLPDIVLASEEHFIYIFTLFLIKALKILSMVSLVKGLPLESLEK